MKRSARLVGLVSVMAVGSACGDGTPPSVVELTAMPDVITVGEATSIVAFVTDDDGLEDIVGGKLTSADGTFLYGPFGKVSNGVFAATVSWSHLHDAEPITFREDQVRNLRAEFLDNSEGGAEATVSITLTCDGLMACSGMCVDLMTSTSHCGACGQPCPETYRCENGACASNCIPCLQTWCSIELAACSGECSQLRACLQDCEDQACADECWAAHPAGQDKYMALYQCHQQWCPGHCTPAP